MKKLRILAITILILLSGFQLIRVSIPESKKLESQALCQISALQKCSYVMCVETGAGECVGFVEGWRPSYK